MRVIYAQAINLAVTLFEYWSMAYLVISLVPNNILLRNKMIKQALLF